MEGKQLPVVIKTGEKNIDPVCGMTVDPATAAGVYLYKGKTYSFCSLGCLNKFKQAPEAYSGSGESAPEKKDIEYTCPMHPEIVQLGPGSCPICGMALEPKVFSLDVEEDNSELRDMTRRFWICAVLTLPVFLLAMAEMLPGDPLMKMLPMGSLGWIQFLLAT